MTPEPPRSGSRRVVLLTRESDTTALVANFLAARFGDLTTVVESPESRFRVARRRANRIGWVRVGGQLAFVFFVASVLSHRARPRVRALLESVAVSSKPVPLRRVDSVNGAATRDMLQQIDPEVVVVLGTRIISSAVLESVECPFVNLHAGITPRYRGLHGVYWALSEGRPDLAGTTVHVVDAGIDTGNVLGRCVCQRRTGGLHRHLSLHRSRRGPSGSGRPGGAPVGRRPERPRTTPDLRSLVRSGGGAHEGRFPAVVTSDPLGLCHTEGARRASLSNGLAGEANIIVTSAPR